MAQVHTYCNKMYNHILCGGNKTITFAEQGA